MPWTLAHPALVVPLARVSKGHLPLLALSIGSLSPDFGYYIRYPILAHYSHNLLNSLYTALPICLLLLALLSLLRQGLLQLFPLPISQLVARHIPVFKKTSWISLLLTILATILGIWSHIFWDSFTHKNPAFAGWWPFVLQQITFFNQSLPLYKILQHMSSLIGASILIYLFVRSVYKDRMSGMQWNTWQTKFWLILLPAAGVISIMIYILLYPQLLPYLVHELPHFMFMNAIISSNIILVVCVLLALILQFKTIFLTSSSQARY